MNAIMLVLKNLGDVFLFLWVGQFALIVGFIALAFVAEAFKAAFDLTDNRILALILGTVFVALIALTFVCDPYPIGDIPFARRHS